MDEESAPVSRPGPSRIAVVDDHPLFREALIGLLGGQPDLEVVGEAADGREALKLCRRLRPDVVLMDVRMPGIDGVAATREIKRELPRTVVLMLTASEDHDHLTEALKAGAAGYVLKDASKQQIIGAIQRALRGESPLNQELAMRLLRRPLDETPKASPENAFESDRGRDGEREREKVLLVSLTSREVEVLRLLMRGQSNQEISRNLLISVSTVKKHMRQVIAKLGASDRVQAAVRAIELGLLPKQEGQ